MMTKDDNDNINNNVNLNDIVNEKRDSIESLCFEVRGGVEPPWPVLQTGD